MCLFFIVIYVIGSCSPQEKEKDTDDYEDDEDDSIENSDDGRIYKNPRNSPSSECPRDEEQATLLVSIFLIGYFLNID